MIEMKSAKPISLQKTIAPKYVFEYSSGDSIPKKTLGILTNDFQYSVNKFEFLNIKTSAIVIASQTNNPVLIKYKSLSPLPQINSSNLKSNHKKTF